MDTHIVETPQEARQAEKTGRVRYILAISTALVIILFAVAYVIVI